MTGPKHQMCLPKLNKLLKKVQVPRFKMDKDPTSYGDAVSNAIFHVERGHWLVERAVERFAEAFRGNVWASGGPNLVLWQTQ